MTSEKAGLEMREASCRGVGEHQRSQNVSSLLTLSGMLRSEQYTNLVVVSEE